MDAALRELIEEVGLRDVELAGPLWERRVEFVANGIHYDQHETFFLTRLHEGFDVVGEFSMEQLQAEGIVEQRWWSLDELDGVLTGPEDLVQRVRRLR